LYPIEILVSGYRTNRPCHNSKDNNMKLHRRDYLKYFNVEKDECTSIIHAREGCEPMNSVLEVLTPRRRDDWFSYQQMQ
jgi:hypothetical protein